MSQWGNAARVIESSLRVTSRDGDYLATLQSKRLGVLLRHARTSSPYFRSRLRDLPDEITDLTMVPPTTKPDLMEQFDEWVTDPRLRLPRVQREFLSHPELLGRAYLRRYHVFTTSGTTGTPAVIVHDQPSWLVAQAVSRIRVQRQLFRHGVLRTLTHGFRSAVIVATGGHYGGSGMAAFAQGLHPALSKRIRVVSALDPIADQVAQLTRFQPTFLTGYPSALLALSREQQAGRLHLQPLLLLSAGEHLSEQQRADLETTFDCHVLQGYAATEVPGLAMECDSHRFHLNADWYLLEPVDEHYLPVPIGTPSTTCLVTNLANFTQPIIRYNLGDRIRFYPDFCECGSRLPSFDVEGRTNDVVHLAGPMDETVDIIPLAIESIVEESPGVHRFQLVNPNPHTLMLRLEPEPGVDRLRVWDGVRPRLLDFLAHQGATQVKLKLADEPPMQEPGGKLRQVIRQ